MKQFSLALLGLFCLLAAVWANDIPTAEPAARVNLTELIQTTRNLLEVATQLRDSRGEGAGDIIEIPTGHLLARSAAQLQGCPTDPNIQSRGLLDGLLGSALGGGGGGAGGGGEGLLSGVGDLLSNLLGILGLG